LRGIAPLIREKSLSDNELTSLAPARAGRSRVAHPLHFATPSNNRGYWCNRPCPDRQAPRARPPPGCSSRSHRVRIHIAFASHAGASRGEWRLWKENPAGRAPRWRRDVGHLQRMCGRGAARWRLV